MDILVIKSFKSNVDVEISNIVIHKMIIYYLVKLVNRL